MVWGKGNERQYLCNANNYCPYLLAFLQLFFGKLSPPGCRSRVRESYTRLCRSFSAEE
jgi:hypothetical protein